MFRFRLYGLDIASDRRIEGLSGSARTSRPQVRVHFDGKRASIRADEGLDPFALLRDGDLEYLRVLRRGENEFVFRFHDGARFEVSARGGRVAATWPGSITFQDATSYLLGPVLGFVARLRGTVCLHASAVRIGGAAVAFLGPSGAGKSSLCAYFAQRGASVLADDVLALSRRREEIRAHPGPARLRLWPDSARHLYGAGAELPRVLPSDPGWDKRIRDVAGGGSSAPLVAIYARGAGESRFPRVTASTGREALLLLAANRYPVRLPVPSGRGAEFDFLAAVAERVPLRRIHARRGLGGLGALRDAVLEDLRGLAGFAARAGAGHA